MRGLHSLFSQHYSKYSNDNYEWVHYIHDHYRRLMSRAVLVDIDPYRMNTYNYRLQDFLERCNVPKEADWLVLYINQLGSDKDFDQLRWLYLPDMADVELMRQEFDTQDAHARSIVNRIN